MSILVLQHSADGGPGRLARVLVDYGHRLRVLRSDRGDEYPPDLDAVDGVIVLGGQENVRDAAATPWMSREIALLRDAHSAGLPVIGICLGSQMLATALGGEVGPLENGATEIGFRRIRLSFPGTIETIFAGVPWSSMQFHWHRYQVTKLPPEATPLATSELCAHQAWRVGLRTFGFQFHFELESDMIQQWGERYADELRSAGIGREAYARDLENWYAEFDRLSTRLCRSLTEYVLPPRQRLAAS
ncbi:MAG: type 1 glutamine amidotransferase [Phycisphaerales bacterium]